jgi:hypothetical protein
VTLRARPFRAFAILALGLSFASCSPGVPVEPGERAATPGFQASLAAPTLPFLERVADAPSHVAHAGRRRVEVRIEVEGVQRALVYVEHVVADGQGRYSILPVAVETPAMTTIQREVFDELQRARQGFFFKHRDLRVRDVALFLENYAVHAVAEPAIVAGTSCVELEIAPRRGPARSYRLAVEPGTGLVLRTIERDASGAEVGRTEFQDFTLAPELDQVEWHVETLTPTPLQDATFPATEPPARPQILPEGYREIAADLVAAGGDLYVRRVFGDGLETAFFLERRAPAAGSVPVTSANPVQATPAGPKNLAVRIAEVGAFRVAEVDVGARRLLVVGKLAEDEVLAILRSAL